MTEERQIHEQMQRLYRAADELRGVTKKARLADLLHVSPQNIRAWEERGISEGGLLDAQAKIGCDAIWLRDGSGDMVRGQPQASSTFTAKEIAELIVLYEAADSDGRRAVFDMARAMARISESSRARTTP